MKHISLLTLGFAITLTACSHGRMRGSVAMKISDQEAHVCMGENEVKPGDKVALYDNKCGTIYEKRFRGCTKAKIGEGEIVQIVNEHYSVMKVNPGVSFREGTIIEKQ